MSVQKANSLDTWWVGKSPKHGIQKRVLMRRGLTDEECEQRMKIILKNVDETRDNAIKREAYINSDEYPRSKVLTYKMKELEELKKEIQGMRDRNNSIYAGGYSGPAIMDHKVGVERIEKYEQERKLQIEKKFDGSPECLAMIRKLAVVDDAKYEEAVRYNQYLSSGINRDRQRVRPRMYFGNHTIAQDGGKFIVDR